MKGKVVSLALMLSTLALLGTAKAWRHNCGTNQMGLGLGWPIHHSPFIQHRAPSSLFRNGFGFDNFFDDFFDDPWLIDTNFWRPHLGYAKPENQGIPDTLKQWETDKRKEWESLHQQRRDEWEQQENLARENFLQNLKKEREEKLKHYTKSQVKNEDKMAEETNKKEVQVNVVGSELSDTSSELVAIQVAGFSPEELSIKMNGHQIHISGRHTSGNCEGDTSNCFIKEFKKTLVLPKQIDSTSVSAKVGKDGILRVNGQLKETQEGNTEKLTANTSQGNEKDIQNDKTSSSKNFKSHDSDEVNSGNVQSDELAINPGDKYSDDHVTIEVVE